MTRPLPTPCTSASAWLTASAYDPNRAVAARTAVVIAMPLVIAFVVLPTASRSVRICAASASPSPDSPTDIS
ncbi:Uncharacterised protein [Mycobacteroides abscessus]|nr:Uncharacterised protein [Mycobacteroides abscessus]